MRDKGKAEINIVSVSFSEPKITFLYKLEPRIDWSS